MSEQTGSKLVKEMLELLGEDPNRDGLQRTPDRVWKSLKFLTSGYDKSIEEVVNSALFEVPEKAPSDLVIVKDIEVYSLCEHHLLPFYGKCHVGYIPNGRVLGLSKIPRLLEVYSRRLQVQERLTAQLADCLMEFLKPQGVGVVIEANHLCMMMRGVEKQHSSAKTSALRGEFLQTATRTEFFNLIK